MRHAESRSKFRFGISTLFVLTLFAAISIEAYRRYRMPLHVHPTTFNGIDDVAEFADAPELDLAGNFTIEAWVRLPRHQSAGVFSSCIVRKGAGVQNTDANYHLGVMNGSNQVSFNIGNGIGGHQTIFSRYPLTAMVWTHVAAVRSEDAVSIFVDGVLAARESPRTVSQQCNDEPLRIGGVGNRSDKFFLAADIDEVRIWSVARSEAQIKKYLNRDIEPNSAELAFLSRASEGKR